MKTIRMCIEDAVKKNKPRDVDSFLSGFQEACDWFGVWKDGEQFLGSGSITFREIKKAVEEIKATKGAGER